MRIEWTWTPKATDGFEVLQCDCVVEFTCSRAPVIEQVGIWHRGPKGFEIHWLPDDDPIAVRMIADLAADPLLKSEMQTHALEAIEDERAEISRAMRFDPVYC